MKENRIEPTAFNVEILRDDLLPIANASCQGTQSKLVFIDESVSFIECIYNANKTRWSYRENQPGSIAFNPRIAHENDNFINHLVEHELTHAIAGDGKIAKSLVRFFVKNAHVTYDEVSRHLAYIKVILAQEIIADVRHALKSPYLAECAFDNTGYPETYGLLALITNNWDFLANIAKQETRVEKNVDNNVINKK